jgi:hypothetical protein
MGIEPMISTLARSRITTLLSPHYINYIISHTIVHFAEEVGFEPTGSTMMSIRRASNAVP